MFVKVNISFFINASLTRFRGEHPEFGYNVVEKTSANLNMNSGKASYALYPVWILNTTYRGEHFKFAVNGQTGKTAGDMPVDEGALWRYFGICTAVCSAVLYGLLWIFV